jgi:hypothetical protein
VKKLGLAFAQGLDASPLGLVHAAPVNSEPQRRIGHDGERDKKQVVAFVFGFSKSHDSWPEIFNFFKKKKKIAHSSAARGNEKKRRKEKKKKK